MEAWQDDVRRALVNAWMPVPICAVLAALQADQVIKILPCRDLFIAAKIAPIVFYVDSGWLL